MTTRGIVLFAFGHPNYGEMAVNMAASLRGGGIHVTLFYHGDALKNLTEDKLSVFDRIELIDDKHIIGPNGLSYLRAKVCLYDITPYHETIFFDADTLWLGNNKRISNLFTELSSVCDFTMTNSGSIDIAAEQATDTYNRWVSTSDVLRAYKIKEGRLFNLNSEFIYFKNTKENERYFKKVKQIFDAPKVKVKEFAGGLPDEFAYCIASMLCNIYPHQDNYRLLYWQPLDRVKGLPQIMKEHSGVSVGGNAVSEQMKHLYNVLAGMFTKQAAIINTWKLEPKKRFLKERQSL